MLSVIKSIVLQGLEGILVNVEVDISSGMPGWQIIGLPDIGVKESKERIRTAIKNCGIDLLSRKYIINLSYTIYNKLNCMCYNIVAYYQLSNEKRDIIDNVVVTEGTSLN